MNWQDWGDVRKKRGGTPAGKKHKRADGWQSGEKVATDARIAKRNHEKAMREQKAAEEKARKDAAVKEKAAKKAAKKNR